MQQIGKILITKKIDYQALELAVKLSGVSFPTFSLPIVSPVKCRLPFPKSERECTDENTPKIYVACLSAYNNGDLHGLWIDATQEPEDIQDDINWMLSWSPLAGDEACEEWAIHDYENWFGIKIKQHDDINKLAELAAILQEHGEPFAFYRNYYGDDVTAENFEENYLGIYESQEDFVYEQWEDSGQIKELEKLGFLSSYIDWKAIAHDSFIDSYFSIEVSGQKIYVFSQH